MKLPSLRAILRCRLFQPVFVIPAFGLLLIACVWLVVLRQLAVDKESVISRALADLESVASQYEEETLRTVKSVDRWALRIKYEFELSGVPDAKHMMGNNSLLPDEIDRVSIADSSGSIIANSRDTKPFSIADRDYFRRHAAVDTGKLEISEPIVSRVSGEVTVVLSRRLNGAEGQFTGVVAMSVRPSAFANFYPRSQLGGQGVVSVVGRDGVFRAWRVGDRPVTTPDSPAPRLLARVDASPVGTYIGESSVDGIERLIAYRTLANYPLIVSVGRASHEVLAAFEIERRNYLVTVGIASAALVAFFALVTQLVVGLGRSKAEIKAQRAFLLTLVDNIPLGVSVRDVRPASYGKIILFNAANEQILGVAREMALGHTSRNTLPPPAAARVEESDRQMLMAPATQELTEAVDVAGRGVRQLHVVRAPVFRPGDSGRAQVEYIISITSDVTDEQKSVEAARLAAKVFETTSDAIILSDPHDRAIMVNSAFSRMMGVEAHDVFGRAIGDSPFHGGAPADYTNQIERLRADGSFGAEVTIALERREPLPCWLSASCVRDAEGNVVNYIRVLTDIAAIKASQHDLEVLAASLSDANTLLTAEMTERARAATALHNSNEKLQLINVKLHEAQGQVVQSEKLASIGQLAAGVAHEINNPIGYVLSNFTTLEEYVRALFEMLAAYEAVETTLPPARATELAALRQKLELTFLKQDIPSLMTESREGISRVRKIVQDLKNFSRTDNRQDWTPADLHAGLDSTLNIVINEIKYKADVIKEYGELPEVECLASQLNQVFMNLLVNAAQAIDKARGRIVIRTGVDGQQAWVEVADDGGGMTPEVKARVFDPFFTTKPVGKGTGLGLSLSYGIVQRHGGRIDLASEVGKGTTFRIWLPIRHAVTGTPAAADAAPRREAEQLMSAVGD